MAQPKYTLYKYVKLPGGKWRYCRAALYKNHTIKRDAVVVAKRRRSTRKETTTSPTTAIGSMLVLRWLKLPILMERGDRLDYATNPPEPYADTEIVAMERAAKGKWNLLARLYRSTGCRLQEITHLHATDVNPYTKTVFIHEKPCMDCPDCRARGGVAILVETPK